MQCLVFVRARVAPLLFCVAAAAASVVACDAPKDDWDDETTDDALVGGTHDLRWSASGYLVRDGEARSDKPACGATLIAPNVAVTAGHCVLDEKVAYAFGTGDLGSGALVHVRERHIHPQFDKADSLRRYDVAVLVLEHDVAGVHPAELPAEKPAVGCNIQTIGYHADAPGKPSLRRTAPACTLFRVTLGQDPIFEVHPRGKAGLCVADGDEGSAVVSAEETREVLVGVYVGSVTQGITDCRGGWQYLDGYESAFGYRDFLVSEIERAKQAGSR